MHACTVDCIRYGESANNTAEENSSVFPLIQMHWLPAISKGMWALKLCTSKILQYLTEVAG